jgi:hypothetical protein
MDIVEAVKNPLRKIKRRVKRKMHDEAWLDKFSDEKLLSLMRHEAHRIEKAFYNGIVFGEKSIAYSDKRDDIFKIIEILMSRDVDYRGNQTVIWAREIAESFDNFEVEFIQKNIAPPYKFDALLSEGLKQQMISRRSCRVWAASQPSVEAYSDLALQLIDVARWAPTSGNRQPWRFMVFTSEEDRKMFTGIKERHTVLAPLLIFVGMDKRLYGAFGKSESGIFIDAGAAIENMILYAQCLGYGTCWNHFGRDFIETRQKKY